MAKRRPTTVDEVLEALGGPPAAAKLVDARVGTVYDSKARGIVGPGWLAMRLAEAAAPILKRDKWDICADICGKDTKPRVRG